MLPTPMTLLCFRLVLLPTLALSLRPQRAANVRAPQRLRAVEPPLEDEEGAPAEGASSTPAVSEASSVGEYVFGRPGEFQRDMALLGTSPRRIALYGSLGVGIAAVGDLFGVTSAVLSASPAPVKEFASATRLDTYYLVGPLRRYVDDEYGFEVRYPKRWLGDQSVYVARTRARAGMLASDPDAVLRSLARGGERPRAPAAVAAFGPAAGTFRENLSVFSATVPGVSLAALGPPRDAAQRLLDTAVAPPSSGKVATLLAAEARPDGAYAFEYRLALPARGGVPGPVLHNLAVAAVRGSELLTMTILCEEASWPDRESSFRDASRSFKLTR